MLVLERKGDEVFCNGRKLTINPQATKGPNKEVVKVDGLEGSNGQKWISLSRLNEGINEIECQAREITHSVKYQLTADEQAKVDELQAQIDAIIEAAKARKELTLEDIKKLPIDQQIIELQKYIDRKRGV